MLKRDINAIYQAADAGATLDTLLTQIIDAFRNYEEAFSGITYSYRLSTTDTGISKAFALDDGKFSLVGDDEEVDAAISGTEKNLLAVIRRELAPLSALLFKKIKLKGSKNALIRLGEFL